MKELSIKEKAQRYNEAISKLRRFMEQGVDPLITRADVQDFFPELKESEGERIRKDMMETIKKESKDFPSSVIAEKSHTWLTWLEKQVEQKPAEWSEEDESRMNNLCHFLEEFGHQYYGQLILQDTISWLKSLRPQNTWKPSDEQMKAFYKLLNCSTSGWDFNSLESLYGQLKKLKEE